MPILAGRSGIRRRGQQYQKEESANTHPVTG
jgi:hypothetical protein